MSEILWYFYQGTSFNFALCAILFVNLCKTPVSMNMKINPYMLGRLPKGNANKSAKIRNKY